MTETPSQLDKWIFVIALSVLGAAMVWQLIGQDSTAPVDPPTVQSVYPPPESVREFTALPGGLYSSEELTYFSEIAFGAEHRDVSRVIRKWRGELNIRVEGDPTAEDLRQLEATVDLLNQLQREVVLSIGYFETSLVIHFAPEREFKKLDSRYADENPGFFWVGWVEDELYLGTILVDSENVSQAERNALITEELTQSLGLMNDSNRYADSLFNDETIVPDKQLSALDETLVTMLYRPELLPGMAMDEAMEILRNVKRPVRSPEAITP